MVADPFGPVNFASISATSFRPRRGYGPVYLYFILDY